MNLLFEIKYSIRHIQKSLGHSLLCIAVVALSVSIALVALTLVYNITLKPLEFNDGDRWVQLTGARADGVSRGPDTVDAYLYEYIKDNNTVFEQFGAMRAFSESRVSDGNTATRVLSAELTPNMFELSGIEPLLGRTLTANDANGGRPVAVISYGLWQSYFSSNESIVGQTANFDEQPMAIVGVMPQNTVFGMKHDVWIAAQPWGATQPSEHTRTITPIGVLKSGINRQQAELEINRLIQQVLEKYPDFYSLEDKIIVTPFRLFMVENSVFLFYAVAVFAALIVLLGLVNMINLLTSRALERKQEFAIRGCMGSSLLNLMRPMLVESALICFFGALFGAAIAWVGMNTVNTLLENIGAGFGWQVPPSWLLHFDGIASLIALSVLAMIWLLCGLIPAWRLCNQDLTESLGSGTKGSTGQRSFRVAKILVGVQVVASCFLLVVGGSLLNSIYAIVNTDYGIDSSDRYVVSIELPSAYRSLEQRLAFIESLSAELRTRQGVADATVVSALPHEMSPVPYAVSERDTGNNGDYPNLRLAAYSPNAFDVLGIELIDGRVFDNTDTSEAAVIIVDQRTATTNWPNESPLGKPIQLRSRNSSEWYRVVGVTESVLPAMSIISRENTAFVPITHIFSSELDVVIIAPTLSPSEIMSMTKEVVAEIDSSVAVYRTQTMQDYLTSPTYGLQMIAKILVSFGLVAVALAVIGIFAIISRMVLQQKQYIGIRRAVGSSNGKVLWHYLRQGIVYLVVGVMIGGGSSLLIAGRLANFFTDLMAYVPSVLTVVMSGLALLIAMASLLPVKHILADEPGDTLRQI